MKHKLTIVLIALLGISNLSRAQEDSTKLTGLTSMYSGIYHVANQFNDPAVARMALYQILMLSPEKTKVLDSLALFYYNFQQWSSVALVSKENLRINPNNELAMELSGIALESLGMNDEALANYERLFLKTDDTNTLYKVAFLQYSLKRYKESTTSIDILTKRTDVDTIKLVFPKVDKTQQEVPMRAAITNLRGLIAKDEGNIPRAKELFLMALKLSPGFEIAQINLRDADK